MGDGLEVPALVRQKALHSGPEGVQWLAELPRVVAELERRWSVTVEASLSGGSAAFVARVRGSDGEPAVLKLAAPGEDFDAEVSALTDADGHGYVRLLASDAGRKAMLQEALGSSLAALSLPPEQTLKVLCGMLREAWKLPPTPARRSAHVEDKAVTLHRLIVELWDELGEPCSRAVRLAALRCAERRASAFTIDRCVVVHGDSHPANALQVLHPRPGAEVGFVFVDPDGFLAEPAYDLGVVLRDWCDEILTADDPHNLLRGYCDLLAAHTGVDAAAIWEWGLLERVSSGLFCLRSGLDTMGQRLLASAELLSL